VTSTVYHIETVYHYETVTVLAYSKVIAMSHSDTGPFIAWGRLARYLLYASVRAIVYRIIDIPIWGCKKNGQRNASGIHYL